MVLKTLHSITYPKPLVGFLFRFQQYGILQNVTNKTPCHVTQIQKLHANKIGVFLSTTSSTHELDNLGADFEAFCSDAET